MKGTEILSEADGVIGKDRQNLYGVPERNFQRIADFWTAYLDYPVSPSDVALMLGLLKIARTVTSPQHLDNYVDLCGYAALAGELIEEPSSAAESETKKQTKIGTPYGLEGTA